MTDWTRLETKHQASLEYYVGPFDKTYGNDMWDEPDDQNEPCDPLQTPQVKAEGIEVERTIG